jgi:ribosomal protein S27AE
MTVLRYCKECFLKQQIINKLTVENERLKASLRFQERSAREGAFGASTPSSKIPIKPNTLCERQALCGGLKRGHAGHGRTALSAEGADRVERIALEQENCPQCGEKLLSAGLRCRTITDLRAQRVEKVLLRLERKRCPKCGRRWLARARGVLPRGLYSNALLAHLAEQHYLHGTPLGVIERQTGLAHGSLWQAFKPVAGRLEPAVEALLKEYRRAPVRHADETGWRTDGQNGYVWLFATRTISLFRFRATRAASVPAEVLGKKPLPGVLVVDRYHGYNKAPVALEYCYSHLKRDTEAIEKEFPDEPEVAAFVGSLVPALAEAMTLRTLGLPRKEFLRRAARTKRRIIAVTHRQARHPAIRKIQNIFREHRDRLYHWARDPSIPAENNLAERDLRPLVVARKVSFGSQSVAGARTRETLMTLLHTLKKRHAPPAIRLQSALDRLVENPSLDPHGLLFAPPKPKSHSSPQ